MAYTPQVTGNAEMLQIADAVAREKNIDRESVLEAMEQAIQIAGRRKYGAEHDIKADIDRKSGAISLYKQTHVVEEYAEEEEERFNQLLVADAQKRDANLNAGDVIREELPPIDFGRIAAQTAKQVIVQKVRDAERDRQYEEFKDKIGEIVNGVVKRVEYGNVIVDFGRTEAMIRRDELIPRESFRVGDRIRAYIFDVRREKTGPQVFLSRTHPDFMKKLFAQEVPEIYDGIIEIVAVARDPGSRAKIAVRTNDPSVNPVLSCVGVRGTRVQAVVTELQGEKVDIIEYSDDAATFIVNALASAEVSKVVIDEDNNRIEVVVPDDQLSLAIGRRGQNVRLASQLIGWNIDILTEESESERRTEEFNKLSGMFIEALNVEEVIAHLLVTEGFSSIEEVGYVPVEDLSEIEGFDEDVAAELRQRARDWLEAQQEQIQAKMKEMGVQDDLIQFEALSLDLLKALVLKGIKSRDDLADLAGDEFAELIPNSGMDEDEINALIMKAREHWFDGEESGADDSQAESA
ncbi:MAG: transcription termination factor NusA [Rickettsiales bacterium]|nr:transcription termination factor NusA [Rickettsiales bacterium]